MYVYVVLLLMCNERIRTFILLLHNSVRMPHYVYLRFLGQTVEGNCMNVAKNVVL